MPDMLELLWFDTKNTARILKKRSWKQILDETQRTGEDTAMDGADDPALPNQTVPPEDSRQIFLTLARAPAVDSDSIASALHGGVREDGKVAPQLLLVAGELRFGFDELEMLKATITTATPFTGGDQALKDAIDAAMNFLGTPGLLAAPSVIEAVTSRIRNAFGQTKRAVSAGFLEAQTERALLEQRHYQRRMINGAAHIRALLYPEQITASSPTDKKSTLLYLPADVATKLPLYPRFPARIIAETHLSADPFEPDPIALRALALARLVPQPAQRPLR